MDEQRPPRLWWGMWKRFLIAGFLIAGLSGAATATVALNKVTDLANEVFPRLSHIATPKGLITPEYGGGPQTFLVLGSDRRSGSKNAEERAMTPHSDTILLVRFDPEQEQTSVLSIPRDLEVNIKTRSGALYPNEKINAAYTIGSKEGGVNEGIVLAAETIEREVFPGLAHNLNGIIDVNFAGFIKVVDALGCAYVNVDHRYYNPSTGFGENYSSINLQPGYQRLCYEHALSYVRYRHEDSDLVRVARQQDFLRSLRQQIGINSLGQIERVAKAVGHAIRTNFPATPKELILLSTLVAFSQTKPIRQVKFLYSNANAQVGGGSYVTSTPELERQTLDKFLNGHEELKVHSSASQAGSHSSRHHRHAAHHTSSAEAARRINLYPTSTTSESEVVKPATEVPFPVLYPTLETGSAQQVAVRPYDLPTQQGRLKHAYVIVWRENTIGGYYDFEGSDWLNPPLFAHARTARIGGRAYRFVDDGAHIHVIGWREGKVLYWLTNTLLEELSNSQMLAIVKSAAALR